MKRDNCFKEINIGPNSPKIRLPRVSLLLLQLKVELNVKFKVEDISKFEFLLMQALNIIVDQIRFWRFFGLFILSTYNSRLVY